MFTIGSDFEYMVERNGSLFNIEGIIGGTKKKPVYLDENGTNIQEDNVLAEGATSVCYNKQQWMDAVRGVARILHDTMSQHNLKIVTTCSASYPTDQLKSKQARTFGCESSFNAYTEMESDSVDASTSLRVAGGHVHLGIGDYANNPQMLLDIAKAMDAFVAVPLMLAGSTSQRDMEYERRTMYGKAGEFRIKPYGIEYRTLSNYWTFDDNLIAFVYEASMNAVQFVIDGGTITEDMQPVVEEYINKGTVAPPLNYLYSLPNFTEV